MAKEMSKDVIKKFASNLLENMEDLEPEFSRVLHENYWELLETESIDEANERSEMIENG